MINKVLIKSKIKKMLKYIKEIETYRPKSLQEYKNNLILKRFIERNLELAIQEMIDICKHLVSRLNLEEPSSYANCIDILVEENIISKDRAEIYKQMIKFRNLLIHTYEKIIDDKIYGIIEKHLKDFNNFAEEIEGYLRL